MLKGTITFGLREAIVLALAAIAIATLVAVMNS